MSDIDTRNVTTPVLGLNQPDVGGDVDDWGNLLNANAAVLDKALLTTGGTMSGTLNITMNGGQLAQFFRNGYGATLPAMTVQTAGTASTQTNFQSLVVSVQATHDDGPAGAQGVLHSALTLTGKSRTDLYAIHATAYVENLTSDLTPFPLSDGSSQHGGIATQTVKVLPSGGIPQGKRQPDVFTHWWQNVNQSNQGSAAGGADVLLEADVSGNGPDDFWKISPSARSCNTTAGSPTLTGITDTSPFIAGEWINVSQAGDAYVYCRVTAVTANTVTIDTNAVASITGAIAAVAGGTRFSFQNVLSNNVLPAAGGTSFEWAYGHFQDNTDAPASGTATWGIGFAYYGRYYIAASDYSLGRARPSPYSADGINRGVSIKMAAGQKLALDGDGYRGTWLTGVAGGGLEVVKDGTAIVTFDAVGGILLGSAPTLPAHAATKQYVDAQVDAGGPFLPLTGGTLTGSLSITDQHDCKINLTNLTGSDWPGVSYNCGDGLANFLQGQRNGLNRWQVVLTTTDAETGGNAGSDLSIQRFDDDGNFIDTPLSISRASGAVSFTAGITAGALTLAADPGGANIALAAVGGGTVGIRLGPAGSGAVILGAEPDGTPAGGDARAPLAFDAQVLRTVAAQVAGGYASAIVGGRNNTITGPFSLAANESNTVAGEASVAFGYSNVISGLASSAPGGSMATDRGRMGVLAWASDPTSAPGYRQRTLQILSGATGDATPRRLTADQQPAAAANIVSIPVDLAYCLRITITAQSPGNVDAATWIQDGSLLWRGAGGPSTVTLTGGGAAIAPTHYTGVGNTWSVSLTADTTLGGLNVTVTGSSGRNIAWAAAVETVEIG